MIRKTPTTTLAARPRGRRQRDALTTQLHQAQARLNRIHAARAALNAEEDAVQSQLAEIRNALHTTMPAWPAVPMKALVEP